MEACPVFFETLSAVGLGLPRKALNATLDSIDANEAERAALGRIWDCFIDAGPENRFNHLKYKVTYLYPH